MRFLMSLVLITISFVSHGQCEKVVGAAYEISTANTVKYFELWKDADKVLHRNLSLKTTELWEVNSKGRVKTTRYFDEYKQGIEYQPNEISSNQRDWFEKQYLITEALMHSMTQIGVRGHGCEQVVVYQKIDGDKKILIEWMPNKKLLKSLKHSQKGQLVKEFELSREIKDAATRDAMFAQYQNWRTTDYIDIGDNESDPFLAKMIHLGFVKHSASGVYMSDGTHVGDHQGHEH